MNKLDVSIDNKWIEATNDAYEAYKSWVENENRIGREKAIELRNKGVKVKQYFILMLTRAKFIYKCKTDSEFAIKWGLKIEERELNKNQGWERYDFLIKTTPESELIKKYKGDDRAWKIGFTSFRLKDANYVCDKENVPTKLITITYKDKVIEIYN